MLVPIACRFVPHDQWFVTHLDGECKVKQAKHWILSKCHLQSSGPQTRRPVSPITFAPSVGPRSSLDSLDDGYNEDDEDSEQDVPPRRLAFRLKPRSSSQSAQSASCLVDRYTLVLFSTGSVLEDQFALSWYNIRPYELLEMHPIGTVAPLQRDILAEYIQPYFQAKVRVLRVVWNHRSGRFEVPGVDVPYEQRRHMSKEKFVTHTLDSLSPKSSSPRSEKRQRAKMNWKSRWVVIHQGMLSVCKEHVASPPLQQFALSRVTALRSTDALEQAFSVVTQPRVICIHFRPLSAPRTSVVSLPPSVHELFEQQEPREWGFEHTRDANDPFRGEWVILDMLDDHAFSSILRVLHREASQPVSSSFAPSSSIIAVSPPSPDMTSLGSYDTIPYPEWRAHTVEIARKAGLGDVGKAMAWVLWSEKGLGESLMSNIRHHRQAFLQKMQYKTPTVPLELYGPDDEMDDESEMEWEGWMRDLGRQSHVKLRTKEGAQTSQPPLPPASGASPCGSPRVRSSSLSMSCGHPPEVPKSRTVSTVSANMAPSPRQRSSTLSNMVTTARRKQGREPVSSVSVSGGRASGDVCESVVLCSPPKGQSALMRGMSLQAGKIARGLETAIDFVDDKGNSSHN